MECKKQKNTPLIISVAISFLFTIRLCAAISENNEWLPGIELQSLQMGGTTVSYEPCFKEQMPAFEDLYKKTIQANKLIISQEFKDKQDKLLESINQIIGADENIKCRQIELIAELIQVPNVSKSIIILQQTTTKTFLRQGGHLPCFTYNKDTDTVTYERFISFSNTSSGTNTPIIIPAAGPDKLLEMANAILNPIMSHRDIFYGIAIHEIVELSILEQLQLQHPQLRWFAEGSANCITHEILKTTFGEEAAHLFIDPYSAEKYLNIKNEVNLQYWMQLKYGFGNNFPIEKETSLNHARYCFATAEIQRLVNKKGFICLNKIIQQFKNEKQRTPECLFRIIQEMSGEDIKTRMIQEYQNFSDKDGGLKKYQAAAQKAQQDNNIPEQIYNMLRVLEIQENPFKQENVLLRKQIAILFCRLGHPQSGDEGMNNLVNLCKEVNDPQAELAGMDMFIQYALETDRPSIAIDYAYTILKSIPSHPGAKEILKLSEKIKNN